MDHAEAHERIGDLALEPNRLGELATDPSPEAAELLEHIDGCAACAAELDAWRRTQDAIAMTVASGPLGDASAGDAAGDAIGRDASPPLDVDTPPASLRAAVAADAARRPRGGQAAAPQAASPTGSGASRIGPSTLPASKRTDRAPSQVGRGRWLQAVAAGLAIVLIVGLGVVAVDRSQRGDRARAQAGMLVELARSLDSILRAEDRWIVDLVATDGQPAGTVSWSPTEIVVLTTALAPPEAGLEYRCWVERDGRRIPIGVMDFAGGVGAWAGSLELERYADLDLSDGRLGISLEPVGQPGESPPVLVGDLSD